MYRIYTKILCMPRGYIPKFLLITKLTAFVLLTSVLQLSAAVIGQHLTFTAQNVTLGKVFKEIKLQTGYGVLLSGNSLSSATRVDADFKNAPIEDVMERILSGKAYTYSIEDNTILIKANEVILVKGTVYTEDKAGKKTPFPGVSVREKNGTASASTDGEGQFSIRVNEGAVLVFSAVGNKTQQVTVTKAKLVLNITMESSETNLKDVVITGFNNVNKKTFSGASTKLKASEIKQDGVVDISRMLEGRVAGVSVQNVSGTFGSAPKIRVRGATSITGDNKPLWVVDGVILEDVVNVTNDQLSSGDPSTLFGSSVAGLSSEDIESFEILKDAAATSYYGAKAMNGVIVVTTKKGRIGKPLISYSGNFSVSMKPSYSNYNIMNSNEQLSVYNELNQLGWFSLQSIYTTPDGGPWDKMYSYLDKYPFQLPNTPEAYRDFLTPYGKVNTNWFDALFKNSLMQEHSLSVSTGTEKAQFYVSTSFVNDGGWYVGSGVNRYTANAKATFNPTDRLSFGLTAVGSIRKQEAPGTYGRSTDVKNGSYTRDFDINPFSYALNTSRTTPLYEPNGERAYFKRNFAPFNILTELEENRLKINVNDFKIQGDLGLYLTSNKELKYTFLGAIRSVRTQTEHEVTGNSNVANAYRVDEPGITRGANKFLYIDPEDPTALPRVVLPYGGFYNPSDNSLINYTFRNNLEWNTSFNKVHTLNVFASQEYNYTDRQFREMIGYGYQYDKGGVPYVDPMAIRQGVENGLAYYKMNKLFERAIGLLARATYAYKEKYAVTGTLRYDGSNKLGNSPIARWLPTWNVSGAWNIDQEPFMKDNKTISYMKLRGTYGLTASLGNADNAVAVYNTSISKRPVASEQETVVGLTTLANTDLTWEKQYETNIGLDMNFFNNRITMVWDGYVRKGKDLIAPITTSGIGGQGVKLANYADMKSKGMEMSIGATVIKRPDWDYNTRLTFAYNNSEVTNLKTEASIFNLVRPEGGAVIGKPYRGLYSIVMTGLDPLFGFPTFLNHEGTSNSTNVYMASTNTQYLKYEGPVDPPFTGGFFNSVRYKDFTLSALLSYQAGNKVRLDPTFSDTYKQMQNTPRDLVDRWAIPGDEKMTNVPALIGTIQLGSLNGDKPYNSYNYSDMRVVDGSFVRLKTVTLSYRLKDRWIKGLGMNTGAISFTGNNLWLLYSDKKLHGQDPEFFNSGGVASPLVKQITMALKLGF